MAGTRSYSKLGADLVTFCIGLAKGAYPKYVRDLPVGQRSAIKSYLRALLSPQADEQGPLQRLLYKIFTQKASKPGERYKLTAYRFLILHSFCEEGNIDWCGTITQHISKLVFLGRCAIYQKIKIRMEEHGEGFFSYAIPDPLWLAAYLRHNSFSRARRHYYEYLSLQSDFCLSPLYHSRNLLKRISEDEIKQRVSVELVGPPGKQTSVLIRGTLVDLCDIGKMFYLLLDEIKKRRTELLHGIDLEKHVQLPDIITDEVNNNSPGFYFGDVEENNLKEYENLLFKLLLDDPQLTSEYLVVTADGGLAPNRKKCLVFLREMESIRSVLGTLIFICSGSPYRGTEFATTCIRNLPGGNVRNARFVGGNIALVSGYNKTSFSV